MLGATPFPRLPMGTGFARAAATAAAVAVAIQACGAGWRRPPVLRPGPLEVRQQVQVWHGGTTDRWHAVVIGPDSVSGIPFLSPIDCDSCRLALPRAAVDSVRLGDPVAGFWKTYALVIGVPLLVWGVLCAVGNGCVQPQ